MLLNGTLSLHDIEDVEAFCIWIMESRNGLAPHESEDCLAYLVASAWELSLVYEYSLGTFATFARTGLRRRLADWYRQRNGRTVWKFKDQVYERKLPSFTTLEHRPDEPYDGQLGDADGSCLQDLLGLQRGRGCNRAWDCQERSAEAA